MNATNKLRDGIRKLADAVRDHIAHGESPNWMHYEGELRRLLCETTEDVPHPDTARLKWMLEYYNVDLSCVDAKMRPAPKFRPWTAGEALGRHIMEKARPECKYIIIAASDKYAWTGPATQGTTFAKVLDDFVCDPCGTPCGVLVEGK